MSSFACEHCGADIIDGPTGYVTECEHYPIVERPSDESLGTVAEILLAIVKGEAHQ